jgi:DNA-binding NtrC family response regulator
MSKQIFCLNNIHVAIIEDDPFWSSLIQHECFKKNMILVQNSNSALDFFKEIERISMPNLIFIDYYLNDLNEINGPRVSRIIKNKWPKAVIVLLSANSKVKSVNRKKYGIDLVFCKQNIGIEKIVLYGSAYVYFKRIKKFLVLALIAIAAAIYLMNKY